MDRIGPGTLLAGRYRLAEQVQEDDVAVLWRAEDLTLERPVAVRLLPATHARVQTVLDGARRAALVDDSRLQRVLGVGVEAGNGYVVLEWVTGQDAGALAGKVSEREAVRIVGEAAEALRAAAARGLHHGRLGPHQVLRASDGSVRVVGTAVDVAVAGVATPAAAARPELRDVRDLSAVLYALLTGRWPFGVVEGLLAAPTDKGRPVGARTVRDDVSEPMEQLLSRTLSGEGPDTLDALVVALLAVDGAARSDERTDDPDDDRSGTGAAAAGAQDDEDDTDVLSPVPGTAATGAAAAGVAATGAGAAGVGAAGVAAGPGGGLPGPDRTADPRSPSRTSTGQARPAAPSYAASYAAASAGPQQGPWSPPEDDGWDLLPIGDSQWDLQGDDGAGGYDGDDGWSDGWTPGGWDDDQDAGTPQPWDDRPAAGPAVAPTTVVVPATVRSNRRRPAGAGTGVAVVLLMGAFVVAGLVWALDRFQSEPDVAAPAPPVAVTVDPTPEVSAPPPPPSAEPVEPSAVVQVISPVGVQPLDPQGDGGENDQDAPRAIDGDPGSAWATQRYNTQGFGGLKTGLGLVFDLGEPREVQAVLVDAPGGGGSYEVRTAGGPGFDGSTVVATGQTGAGTVEVAPETPVTTQYLIVWFTALPDNGGDWRGVVSGVQVRVG